MYLRQRSTRLSYQGTTPTVTPSIELYLITIPF
jgi:hypothetical protein